MTSFKLAALLSGGCVAFLSATSAIESPNIERWLARVGILIVAAAALFLLGFMAAVNREYYRRWKTGVDQKFDTQCLTNDIIIVMLLIFLCAIMDIGQAFALVADGWGGLVAITGATLLPLLGYKSVQAVAATKGGPTNVSGGQ